MNHSGHSTHLLSVITEFVYILYMHTFAHNVFSKHCTLANKTRSLSVNTAFCVHIHFWGEIGSSSPSKNVLSLYSNNKLKHQMYYYDCLFCILACNCTTSNISQNTSLCHIVLVNSCLSRLIGFFICCYSNTLFCCPLISSSYMSLSPSAAY